LSLNALLNALTREYANAPLEMSTVFEKCVSLIVASLLFISERERERERERLAIIERALEKHSLKC